MTESIRVLIVDDLAETRQNVSKLLQFEPDIDVIGHAKDGHEAINMVKEHRPDVVLMDINMPGVDGIGASRSINQAVPTTQIIIMSVQSEADYLRQAMLAGARDFLMKPFGAEELSTAIRSVYSMRPNLQMPVEQDRRGGAGRGGAAPKEPGKIISVFSPKGGSGCTTVAINLAVSLANMNHSTILIDGRFQFGDVSVMLNLRPTTTILDLVERLEELDLDLLGSVTLTHSSGLKVLLAPPRPEMAELLSSEKVGKLLDTLRYMFDCVIIDTSSHLTDTVLTMLDKSDWVMLLVQQSLPSLKSASHFYDLATGLDYPGDKIMLIVNNVGNKKGVSVRDISDILKRPVLATIPSDEPAASTAADRGYPLVSGPAQKRPIALALVKLAEQTAEILESEELDEDGAVAGSRFGKLFGNR